MSRYSGGVRKRICASTSGNFLHGHHEVKRGVAFYTDAIIWVISTSSGTLDNWLVMCGKNPGQNPNNMLRDGQAVGTKSVSISPNWQLTINIELQWREHSDWAVAQAFVWDQALTDQEMAQVSTLMLNSLSNASIDVANTGTPQACSRACNMTLPACAVSLTQPQATCQACGQCVAGTYTAPMCNGDCLQCQYGTYATSAGASACAQCSTGSFSAVMGATACVMCAAGTYAPFRGAMQCISVSLFLQRSICTVLPSHQLF
jgi:hypothetical protein